MTTLEQFLILSWMIWKARNKWVFKQSTEQPSVIAGEAIEFWQEFKQSATQVVQQLIGILPITQVLNLTLHQNP